VGTIVNVCSVSHSGSTALALMLGNGPDSVSVGEATAWFRPFRTHHRTLDCVCEYQPCPVWTGLREVKPKGFPAQALRLSGASFVIDSSKDLSWVIDVHRWARRENLRTLDIVLWKDPIDLCYSFWRREMPPNLWRSEFLKYYGRALSMGIGSCSVSFHDLKRRPGEVMTRISRLTGLKDFPAKREFWSSSHHSLFGSRSVRNQVSVGRPTFAPESPYEEAFGKDLPRLADEIRQDADLQRIVRRLQRIDVFGSYARAADVPKRPSPILPPWYYKRRLWLMYRRFFPEAFDVATRW
jgi:hypothetical protein